MQYSFSPRLRMISLVMIGIGIVLYAIGLFLNIQDQNDPHFIENFVKENPEQIYGEFQSAEFQHLNHTPEEHAKHIHHLENQLGNKPWAAVLVPAYLFLGIGGAALFFLSVQFAANAGWSMVISRVMEGIATYIPVGGVIILIIMLASAFHGNHLYHWMDTSLIDPAGDNYDKYIATKSKLWLNVPGWLIRSFLYIILWSVFTIWIKRTTKKLDESNGDRKAFSKLYTRAVLFIVVFALTTPAMA